MQFKHPEVLYFLSILVLPILVHLFQLRRFKTQYFTNVRFLKELVVQTRKSSALKKYLLLATRLLLLTFLILAFAQPFWEAKEAKNAKNELYIIIDNSFSMQAKGKKGELLKRAVQDILAEAPESANFSLLTNTESYWNTDIKSIQRELQNLSYSATPFEPERLIAQVRAHRSTFRKDIVVISDGVGTRAEALGVLNNDEKGYYIPVQAEKTQNIAIDSVYLDQTLDQFYEIEVAVRSYGATSDAVPVALYDGQKLVAKTLVNFNQPRQTLKFTLPKTEFIGYVSLNDNSLEYDNTYYFSLSKPEKSRVMSISESAPSTFLNKIYTPDEFEYTATTLTTLPYALLEKQDAIVLNEIATLPASLQTTLKAFVAQGGNLILIPSPDTNVSSYNALLNALGGGYVYQDWKVNDRLVTKINFNHPLYAGVFEKKTENFQYPNIKAGYSVQTSFPTVLECNDQRPFLSAVTRGAGTMYCFSAPLRQEWGNFKNSPYLIVPTLYNMAFNSQKTGVKASTIGSSRPYIAPVSLGEDEIVSLQKEETEVIPEQQRLYNQVKLTFSTQPQRAGNYTLLRKKETVDQLSFNYPRTESDLQAVPSNWMANWKEITATDQLFDTLQADRSDTVIWKWCILLALLFLLIEIAIQKIIR
jgi:hypothetical protein